MMMYLYQAVTSKRVRNKENKEKRKVERTRNVYKAR